MQIAAYPTVLPGAPPMSAHATAATAATGGTSNGYAQTPIMVYWEVTQACDLACVHCRANAASQPNPFELSTEEGFRLLDEIAGFGEHKPHLVLTGGDPLKRPDIYALIEHAVQAGLQTSITPSGTPLLTEDAVHRLYAAGVRTVALSLDGSQAARHDQIRQVPGSFDRTVAGARWARAAGLSVQINSLVCAQTAADLPDIFQRVVDLDADRWSVFFLVNVGRGTMLGQVTPEQGEALLEWLYELTLRSARPIVKTTEAHHFRRIALQHQQRAAAGGPAAGQTSIRAGFGVRDGAGIMFVSHIGEVYPSGFLPLSVGNVRRTSPVQLYREAVLFRQLRDPAQLKGKCGRCEYRVVCGGSRSRAWAATGDPLETDSLCPYQPRARRAAATEPVR